MYSYKILYILNLLVEPEMQVPNLSNFRAINFSTPKSFFIQFLMMAEIVQIQYLHLRLDK